MLKLRSLRAAAAASTMAFCAVNGAQAAAVSGQGTWETTLQARDINGDGVADAFYDTVLNVTWLADANAAAGTVYDTSVFSTATDGQMTWLDAKAWAANLSVYGLTGWRLPTMADTGTSGCNFEYSDTDCGFNVRAISADGRKIYSEMAHLYYLTLGNKASCDATGNCALGSASTAPNYMLSNTGPLHNMQAWAYWSGVPYAPASAVEAWLFGTYGGYQGYNGQDVEYHALAVRPGDVTAAVPEPETVMLMLLGLAAMVMVQKKRAIRRFDTSADSAV